MRRHPRPPACTDLDAAARALGRTLAGLTLEDDDNLLGQPPGGRCVTHALDERASRAGRIRATNPWAGSTTLASISSIEDILALQLPGSRSRVPDWPEGRDPGLFQLVDEHERGGLVTHDEHGFGAEVPVGREGEVQEGPAFRGFCRFEITASGCAASTSSTRASP